MHTFAWKSAIALLLLALAAPLAAQTTITDAPRRYLVIQADGAAREWEVRPIRISDKNGGTLLGASEGDFQLKVDRWERTGLPRRYATRPWKDAMAKFAGAAAPEGARFYFYAITPKQPLAEGKITLVDAKRRMYSVDFQRLAEVRAVLDDLWTDRLDALKRHAETRPRARQRGTA